MKKSAGKASAQLTKHLSVVWIRSSHRKKVFLKILQNPQENICIGVSFQCLQALGYNFIEKETPAPEFFINFEKCLRTPFYRTPQDDCFWWMFFWCFSKMQLLYKWFRPQFQALLPSRIPLNMYKRRYPKLLKYFVEKFF